jgi:hypothetical protein
MAAFWTPFEPIPRTRMILIRNSADMQHTQACKAPRHPSLYHKHIVAFRTRTRLFFVNFPNLARGRQLSCAWTCSTLELGSLTYTHPTLFAPGPTCTMIVTHMHGRDPRVRSLQAAKNP